jgi:peptidoglycan-associated lipoprotein
MQTFRASTLAVAAIAIGSLTLSGCATKKFVNQQVGAVDTRLASTQGQVSAQETKIGELDRTSREALDRATAAGKLAEGKFLYSMVLSDDSVKFPVNQAEISPEAETRLLAFAQKLKEENRNVYLEIQGHTDSTGSKPLNMRLGQERADAVRLFMNKQGVALNRMATISYADEIPVAPNDNREGRAQNRRVVVIVLS